MQMHQALGELNIEKGDVLTSYEGGLFASKWEKGFISKKDSAGAKFGVYAAKTFYPMIIVRLRWCKN